jgi:hypothetical protein
VAQPLNLKYDHLDFSKCVLQLRQLVYRYVTALNKSLLDHYQQALTRWGSARCNQVDP